MTPSSPTRRSSDLQKIDKARADDQPDHQRRYQRRPRAKRLVADKVEDALEPQPFSQQIKHPNSLPLSIEACKMCDQPAQADRVGALDEDCITGFDSEFLQRRNRLLGLTAMREARRIAKRMIARFPQIAGKYLRSEARRLGKGGCLTCRYRGA